MAWADTSNKGTGHCTNTTVASIAFPNALVDGNVIVALYASWAAVGKTITISKSAGTATISAFTTYKATQWGAYMNMGIAIAEVTGDGTCTISCSCGSGSHNAAVSIGEFSGLDVGTFPTTTLRTDDGKTTGSSTAPTATLTSTAGDLILGVATNESDATPNYKRTSPYLPLDNGYAAIATTWVEQDNSTYQGMCAEYGNSTGNNNVVYACDNDTWDVYCIALIPAAGGPYTWTGAGSMTPAGAAPTRRLDMWRTKTGEL